MRFLYSRRPQIILLVCWLICIAVITVYIGGGQDTTLNHTQKAHTEYKQEAHLDETVVPVTDVSVVKEPAKPTAAQASADLVFNRCTAIAYTENKTNKILTIDLEYTPAQKDGFKLENVQQYSYSNGAVFVVLLDKKWILDTKNTTFTSNLPQIKNIRVHVAKNNKAQLTLLVHATSNAISKSLKASFTKTATGMQITLHVP